MREATPDRDHGVVTSAPGLLAHTAVPRLYRRPDSGLIGGVVTGIAEHLHVRRRLVRAVFVALTISGGLGVALYGAYWIVLPTPPGSGRGRLPVWLEYLIGGIALVAAVSGVFLAVPSGGRLFLPTLLACLGGALIWRQATDVERVRLRRLSRTSLAAEGTDTLGRVRLVAGAVLVIAGGAIVLARADFSAVRDGLLAMAVTIVGLALLTGPWWMRLVAQLGAERSERIRSQERADIAAHLHDSVLQTLALIQRNAASPREVARLARGQERELRTLLYGTRTASGQLADQLRRAAAEVEDGYAVSVEVVLVGDVVLTDDLSAAVDAAREAMVNAAKHSGVTAVSLYAEVQAGVVDIFVKDRGTGFDLAGVAEDRQGVRGSIVGRVERHGGSVEVSSAPGAGTEIHIRMPL
ncbi:PspC domain-containing protein [Jatrophihabitans sp.]|uniref:ATP-binding protein n=1 Tax=Jatrophihabitans sp. TaxID=1932789 RepID=UPI0030C76E11|nr:putative signal transduction histidine kinase [Jatrophihabitans sp.]